MLLDVAFLPADLDQPERSVCIVIDALRASSTIATIVGRGVRELIVCADVTAARALHAALPDALLCGEEHGLPPAGFDHGNSPREYESLDLSGRTVVFATSNGTRALAALTPAHAVLVGSLLNLSACARAARALAGDAASITVVCAGNELGRTFSLDDTVVAGAFIERLVRDGGALPWQTAGGRQGVHLGDRASAAYRLWRSYPAGARPAFGESTHGRLLAGIGLEADLDACARVDRYPVVPRLHVERDGQLVIRPEPGAW